MDTETGTVSAEAAAIRTAAGVRIREAREQADMTQQVLADVLDVTQAAVSRWEAGERDPGIADLVRIADALGVQASSLLPPEPWVIPPAAPDPEPPLPDGIFGRVELPGWRNHTGWITDEVRFGEQMCVVRNWDGQVVAMVKLGPACQVLPLPTPLKRPEPKAAITAGARDDDDEDLDDPDDQYRDAF